MVGSILYCWGEDANLAKEHGYQERGAGRVGGGGQQVRHPGGGREYGGGNEVEEDVLPVQADQINAETHNRVPSSSGPWWDSGFFPFQIVDCKIVTLDLNVGINNPVRVPLSAFELHWNVSLVEAGDPQSALVP